MDPKTSDRVNGVILFVFGGVFALAGFTFLAAFTLANLGAINGRVNGPIWMGFLFPVPFAAVGVGVALRGWYLLRRPVPRASNSPSPSPPPGRERETWG